MTQEPHDEILPVTAEHRCVDVMTSPMDDNEADLRCACGEIITLKRQGIASYCNAFAAHVLERRLTIGDAEIERATKESGHWLVDEEDVKAVLGALGLKVVE